MKAGSRPPEGFINIATAAIRTVGTALYPEAIDNALRDHVAFDLAVIIAYPPDKRPILLHDGLQTISNPDAMTAYLDGAYLLDAIYVACRNGLRDGLHRLTALAPDCFFEGDYFLSSDYHPCISMETGSVAEEIVFTVRLTNGTCIAYSIMRSNGYAVFSDKEFLHLAQLAPLITTSITRQWSPMVNDNTLIPVHSPTSDEAVETSFKSFQTDKLSAREQDIVRLSLRGHSALSASRYLGIAEGTVKNHKKHVYAKLKISSQSELFSLFLQHALSLKRPGGTHR